MKSKSLKPTQAQEVDFYYFIIKSVSALGYCKVKSEMFEKKFFSKPETYSNIVENFPNSYPRETSPEVYEYYVSDIGIKNIRNGYWSLASSKPSDIRINKIKITICEDE